VKRIALIAALCGCGGSTSLDGSVMTPELGSSEFAVPGDGGLPISAQFTMTGCAKLDGPLDAPRCTGPAPLEVTFVPLGEGVTTLAWSFPCGDMGMCGLQTPTVRLDTPGKYSVTLSVAGIGGTATSMGTIVVTAGGTGAACDATNECEPPLTCLCSDGACPGALAGGVCTKSCDAISCAPGELCADLTRGLSDGGVSDEWHGVWCVPGCSQPSDCTRGFSCRDLPTPTTAGAWSWQSGCFADVLGDVGASCLAADGTPDGSRCLSGRCDPLGARGVCTADCSASMSCPSNASCVQFTGASRSQCIARCTTTCNDPLLWCKPSGAMYGFTAPSTDPPGTTYCVPKSCSAPADCAPAGTCTSGFCTR
jgi:PKD repeat protein